MSEHELSRASECRKRPDARIEVRAFGDDATFLHIDAGGRRVAVANHRHQAAAFAQLRKQAFGHLLDRAIDKDQVVWCFGRVTGFKVARDDGNIVASEAGKGLACLGGKLGIALVIAASWISFASGDASMM